MARSYTNKQGDVVEVSQEHLDTALTIKMELQKASPSRKCNWRLHKRMMEQEGFDDSEANESYRCMIKNYQASVGKLESKEKHADLVATSKLQSIKDAVGEMHYAKKDMQREGRHLNKLKSELTLFGIIAEQVREAMLTQLNEQIPTFTLQPRHQSSGKKRLIVTLSDWHIGAVIKDVNGNSFNYEIAKKRVKAFYDEIVQFALSHDITEIDVVCIGDMTEHVQMRKSQGFGVEFNLSVQMVKAYELIRDFLINLTQLFNTTYRGVGGNHDRIEGKKDDNIDGDSTIFVINYMINEFIAKTQSERLQYIESDDINYSATIEVNGSVLKFVHGDNEKGEKTLIGQHAQMDGVVYNAIVMGHLHHYSVVEIGRNRYVIHFGSLKGNDNYTKKGKYSSSASQGFILVHEDGKLEAKSVDLQIN